MRFTYKKIQRVITSCLTASVFFTFAFTNSYNNSNSQISELDSMRDEKKVDEKVFLNKNFIIDNLKENLDNLPNLNLEDIKNNINSQIEELETDIRKKNKVPIIANEKAILPNKELFFQNSSNLSNHFEFGLNSTYRNGSFQGINQINRHIIHDRNWSNRSSDIEIKENVYISSWNKKSNLNDEKNSYKKHFKKWVVLKENNTKEQKTELLNFLKDDNKKQTFEKNVDDNYKLIQKKDFTNIEKTIDYLEENDFSINKNVFQYDDFWYKNKEKINNYYDSFDYLSQFFQSEAYQNYGDLPKYWNLANIDNEDVTSKNKFNKWIQLWHKLIIDPNKSINDNNLNLPFDLNINNIQFKKGYYDVNNYEKKVLFDWPIFIAPNPIRQPYPIWNPRPIGGLGLFDPHLNNNLIPITMSASSLNPIGGLSFNRSNLNYDSNLVTNVTPNIAPNVSPIGGLAWNLSNLINNSPNYEREHIEWTVKKNNSKTITKYKMNNEFVNLLENKYVQFYPYVSNGNSYEKDIAETFFAKPSNFEIDDSEKIKNNVELNSYLGTKINIPEISNSWLTWEDFFQLKNQNFVEKFYESIVFDEQQLQNLNFQKDYDFKKWNSKKEDYAFLIKEVDNVFKFWDFGITQLGYSIFINKLKTILNFFIKSHNDFYKEIKIHLDWLESERIRIEKEELKIKEEEEIELLHSFKNLVLESLNDNNLAKEKVKFLAESIANNSKHFVNDNIDESIKLENEKKLKLEEIKNKMYSNKKNIEKKYNDLKIFSSLSYSLTAAAWAVAAGYYFMAFFTFGKTLPFAISATVQASIMTYFAVEASKELHELNNDINNYQNSIEIIEKELKSTQIRIKELNNNKIEKRVDFLVSYLETEILDIDKAIDFNDIKKAFLNDGSQVVKNTINKLNEQGYEFNNTNLLNALKKKDPLSSIWEEIKNYSISNAIEYSGKKLIQFFYQRIKSGPIFQKISNAFKDSSIFEFLTSFIETIKSSSIWTFISDAYDNVTNLFKTGKNYLTKIFENKSFFKFIQKTKKIVLGVKMCFSNLVKNLKSFITKNLKNVLSKISKGIIKKIMQKLAAFSAKIFSKKQALLATSWSNPILSIISFLDNILSFGKIIYDVTVDYKLENIDKLLDDLDKN